jgi:FixJ family two-component response regulator
MNIMDYGASYVAVVDDDDSLRAAIDSLLRSVGFYVEGFGSAEAFLASPFQERVACVVLDVGLPGMTGLQLQAHLNRGCRPLPVVFVSAAHDGEGRLHAQASRGGALAFLHKPFADEELLSAVRSACTPLP